MMIKYFYPDDLDIKLILVEMTTLKTTQYATMMAFWERNAICQQEPHINAAA